LKKKSLLLKKKKNLKNDKAPGHDCLINEYIKSAISLCMALYLKLLNKILNTGIIPEICMIGIIMLISKIKGNPANPDSYGGITLGLFP
jgi:hypothetical protein